MAHWQISRIRPCHIHTISTHLHLEGILPAPAPVREGVRLLVGGQYRLHDAIDVNLVARHLRVTVTARLVPLYRYVLEVTRSTTKQTVRKHQAILQIGEE